MKKLYTLLVAVLVTATLWAQSPEKMSYQSVIRNSSDALVTNTQIGMQISILQGADDGAAIYTETQTPTTNANGLVSIEIGGGVGFSTIDWANGPYFIKTETDPTGGTNYTITGTSQLLSVPYALHAKTAETVSGGITESDPIFSAWDKSTSISITESQISDLGTYIETEADPAVVANFDFIDAANGDLLQFNGAKWVKVTPNYLTSYTETDPVFTAWDKDYADLINTPTTADGSETKVTAGTNVTISGTGTIAEPYIVNTAGGSDWSLTGNAGTVDGTNFIGTTDEKPFNIRVNNNSVLFLSTDGRIGLNTITPAQLFHLKDTEIPSNFLDDDMDGEIDETGHEMVFTNYGRLGIGTTMPEATVHIAGNIKIVDGTQGAGKVLTSDANGEATWQAVGGGAPTLAIGQNYQGGTIFWLDATGQHGLIAATTDQSTGIRWYAGTVTTTMALADGVGAGKSNTAIIIANQGYGDGTAYAARICHEYKGGNYGDWYLPSIYELGLLYASAISGLPDWGFYWSSTEYSNSNFVWSFNFGSGDPFGGYSTKDDLCGVRAVRAF